MQALVKMLAAHYQRVAPNIFSKSDRLLGGDFYEGSKFTLRGSEVTLSNSLVRAVGGKSHGGDFLQTPMANG